MKPPARGCVSAREVLPSAQNGPGENALVPKVGTKDAPEQGLQKDSGVSFNDVFFPNISSDVVKRQKRSRYSNT